VVLPQQTTESFGALEFSVRLANQLALIDEPVAQLLMISFAVIVLNVFTNGPFTLKAFTAIAIIEPRPGTCCTTSPML
jgi:hypothetical protein